MKWFLKVFLNIAIAGFIALLTHANYSFAQNLNFAKCTFNRNQTSLRMLPVIRGAKKVKAKISLVTKQRTAKSCNKNLTISNKRNLRLNSISKGSTLRINIPACKVAKNMRIDGRKNRKVLNIRCNKTAVSTPTPLSEENYTPVRCEDFKDTSFKDHSNGKTVLSIYPNTFLQEASLEVYKELGILNLANEISLRTPNLLSATPAETRRALDLQSAFDFANLVGKTNRDYVVKIILPPCLYQFKSLDIQSGRESFSNVPADAKMYKPRLYVGLLASGSSIELVSPWSAFPEKYSTFSDDVKIKPKLTYQTSDCLVKEDCRARVLLLIANNTSAKVKDVEFEGDHKSDYKNKYEFYIHENPELKSKTGHGRHGIIMVGTAASSSQLNSISNDVEFDNIKVSQYNFRGIQVFGNFKINGSQIQGIMTIPESEIWLRFSQAMEIRNKIISDISLGISPLIFSGDRPGMSWQAGIYIESKKAVLPSIIENSFIGNVTQAIASQGMSDNSRITGNKSKQVFDHFLYALVSVGKGTVISHNQIFETYGVALKFAGHSDAANSDDKKGAQGVDISHNTFYLNANSLVALVGSGNTFSNNINIPYHPDNDYTKGWFNPINTSFSSGSRNPKISISSFGGNYNCVSMPNSSITKQPGYAITTKDNLIENNIIVKSNKPKPAIYLLDDFMDIFIDQAPGSPNEIYHGYMSNIFADRSVDGTQIISAEEPTTKVYFRKRIGTKFNSEMSLDLPGNFAGQVPDYCVNCKYSANTNNGSLSTNNPCS